MILNSWYDRFGEIVGRYIFFNINLYVWCFRKRIGDMAMTVSWHLFGRLLWTPRQFSIGKAGQFWNLQFQVEKKTERRGLKLLIELTRPLISLQPSWYQPQVYLLTAFWTNTFFLLGSEFLISELCLFQTWSAFHFSDLDAYLFLFQCSFLRLTIVCRFVETYLFWAF